MYSTDDAPFGISDQQANIKVDMKVQFSVPINMNTSVVVTAFHVDDGVSLLFFLCVSLSSYLCV
jgi:hypothetical protein